MNDDSITDGSKTPRPKQRHLTNSVTKKKERKEVGLTINSCEEVNKITTYSINC